MLTKLFVNTTNPRLPWKQFFKLSMFFQITLSVLFHTLLYTLFCNIVTYVFYGKRLSNIINTRLVITLIVIMYLGYIGRFMHSKQVYKDMNGNVMKTQQYLNTHYNSWIFLG